MAHLADYLRRVVPVGYYLCKVLPRNHADFAPTKSMYAAEVISCPVRMPDDIPIVVIEPGDIILARDFHYVFEEESGNPSDPSAVEAVLAMAIANQSNYGGDAIEGPSAESRNEEIARYQAEATLREVFVLVYERGIFGKVLPN